MAGNELKYRGVSISQLLSTLAAAFTSVIPQGTAFMIAGVNYTGAQISALLLQWKVAFDQADEARLQYLKALATRDANMQNVRDLLAGITSLIEAMYSKDPSTFAKFGIPAKKSPRQLSGKEKVAASTKALATRGLRGTKGSRQKEKVKAEGTPVVTAEMPDPTPAPSAPLNGTSNGVVQSNKLVA